METTKKQRNQNYREKMRKDQRVNDPCWNEHEISISCLTNNKSDTDSCERHIKNFKNCEKFWTWIIRDRKSKNIEPHLPAIEDRNEVREQYRHLLKHLDK